MRRINVRQVEAFRAVVTMGSMSKAAELLGVSQPAVSRLVSDFQAAVGFKLFQRLRNGAEPTKDARRLFEHVEKLFTGLEELDREVNAIKSLVTGRVAIGASTGYTSGELPACVAAFREAHPSVTIELQLLPHEQLVERLTLGVVDLIFTSQPVARAGLQTETLRRGELVCALPMNHRLAQSERLSPADLEGETLIGYPRGSVTRFAVDGLLDRAGVAQRTDIEVPTHDMACALVGCGAGVALVNPFSPHTVRAESIAFRPISPSIDFELQMSWTEGSETLASSAFRAVALEAMTRPSTGSSERMTDR